MKAQQQRTVAIVVSGGPAPGINSAISAITVRARDRGLRVLGLDGGFAAFETNSIRELGIGDVSRIHTTGGSVLGTSRFNPLHSEESTRRFVEGIALHGITTLVVIGGDGSAYLALQIQRRLSDIQVLHLPKTIDNDLVLPNAHPSFGFETARDVGTRIVQTLMVDAKTTGRWYVVTTMGRRAGFLALGLGVAAGATTTVIPEEFTSGEIAPERIAEAIFQSVSLRRNAGKSFGVAVLAEGLIDTFAADRTPELANAPRDALGRYRYRDLELSEMVVRRLRALPGAEQGEFVAKNIGYELRCAAPISFDIEYTRFLGWGAVELIERGVRGVMVVRDDASLSSVPLETMLAADGRIRARTVDLSSDVYRAARDFMIR